MNKAEVDFQKVLAELDEATIVHSAAVEVETAARHKVTTAANRLNDAQKAFDRAVEETRNAAAWNTKWYSEKNRGSVAA